MLKKIERLILTTDTWIYLVAIAIAAHLNVIDSKGGWSIFLATVAILLLIYCPLYIFDWFKIRLKRKFNNKLYLTIWLLIFIIYPLFAVLLNSADLFPTSNFLVSINLGGLIMVSLSIFLAVYPLFKDKLEKVNWLKKIHIEPAIIISLILFAMMLASMAVTNLELFWGGKAVDSNIKISKVFIHFGDFLSITFQLLLAYLAGYIFYLINHYFLISKLLKEKGLIIYLFGVVGTVVIFYPVLAQLLIWLPLHQKLEVLTPSEDMNPFHPNNGAAAIAIMLISIPVILTIQWFKQNSQIISLQKQQVQTELDLLKQQINPHFFFNTLNNLYALSLKKSDQTSEVILQLSELMRYVIYKGKEQEVSITEEINYIKDYANLQLIRLKKEIDFRFTESVSNPKLQVPPLLLIILVENAFKHGIEPSEESCYLHLSINSDEYGFEFSCQNSFENHEREQPGIGLENLKRRLELNYGDRYTLDIKKDHQAFKVLMRVDVAENKETHDTSKI